VACLKVLSGLHMKDLIFTVIMHIDNCIIYIDDKIVL
jgi:hypothetical protein